MERFYMGKEHDLFKRIIVPEWEEWIGRRDKTDLN